jgi:hypothetical protein
MQNWSKEWIRSPLKTLDSNKYKTCNSMNVQIQVPTILHNMPSMFEKEMNVRLIVTTFF